MVVQNLGNLMIDLETLGSSSNSVILSIGAVEFNLDTGQVGRTFYANIDIQSCLDAGLNIYGDNIRWWFDQSEAARNALKYDVKNLGEVLYLFRKFVEQLGIDTLMVWGNGSRFDLGLLHDAYRAVKKQIIPWQFRNERDVRTLIMDHLDIKDSTVREGTEHNALDDCLHQIKYCTAVRKLKTI